MLAAGDAELLVDVAQVVDALVATTAAPDFFEDQRRERRDAVLLTTEVSVPHAGLP